MSIYPPPNWLEPLTTFNSSNYQQSVSSAGGVDIGFLNTNYLKFPTAQGDETFTATVHTGNATVEGIVKANNITGTTTTSNIVLYPDITTSNLNLGTGMTTGTLKIGSGTNSNHIGTLDFTSNSINNTTATSGVVNIANSQVNGVLNLGTLATRTGAINIGNGASASSSITIGATNSTVVFNGTPTLNGVNLAPSSISITTAGTIASNLAQNLLASITLASTGTITLPTTRYVGQKINLINNNIFSNSLASTALFRGFGIITAVSPITIYAGQAVVVQYDGTNWVILNKTNETFQPIITNYTTISYTSLNQIGYTFSETVAGANETTVGIKQSFKQITTTPFPVGLYSLSIRNLITAGATAGNVIINYYSSLSTTTISTGFIAPLLARTIISSTTAIASGVMSGNVNGIYTRSNSAQTVYITLEYQITTVVAGGITSNIQYSLTRIA
jgi:hypothetical protein